MSPKRTPSCQLTSHRPTGLFFSSFVGTPLEAQEREKHCPLFPTATVGICFTYRTFPNMCFLGDRSSQKSVSSFRRVCLRGWNLGKALGSSQPTGRLWGKTMGTENVGVAQNSAAGVT